jgi:hypothetical protein
MVKVCPGRPDPRLPVSTWIAIKYYAGFFTGDWIMGEMHLPITCPLCGRRSDHPVENLKEGADLVCPFCRVKLNLHGHMWEEIRNEIAGLKEKNFRSPE